MGQETTCKAVINGERTQGKALLETDVLIFRSYGARKAADLECFASLKDSRAGLQLTSPSEICPAQRVKALLKRVQARKGTVAPAAGPWAAARRSRRRQGSEVLGHAHRGEVRDPDRGAR